MGLAASPGQAHGSACRHPDGSWRVSNQHRACPWRPARHWNGGDRFNCPCTVQPFRPHPVPLRRREPELEPKAGEGGCRRGCPRPVPHSRNPGDRYARPRTRYPRHPAIPTRTLARQRAQDAGRRFGLHRAQGLDRRPRAAREPDCPRHGTRPGRCRALRGDRRRTAAGRDAGAGRRGRAGRGPPRALPHDRRYRGGRRSFAGREQCPRRHAPGRSGRGVPPPGRCGQHGGRHRGALRGLGAHRGETPAARQRRTGAA